ncbi:MAG: beta-lactamase family protein [Lachnospiraceae bacterium]|nr:beta-lactamase family protein [Lachnospiraceae bacterium]
MKNKRAGHFWGAAILAGIIGISFMAVNDGKVVSASDTGAAGNNGDADSVTVSAPEKNDDEYIYCVGSVSKVYVTAAVMRLVDEGKVSLDDPVTGYLPDFKMADERYRDITVRMLMDHTSGIFGTDQIGTFLYEDNSMIHHDTLLESLKGQRLKADPGEYAAYCNDGFDLLELIVEKVSGMTYTDYIIENIAAPTGGLRTGTGFNLTHDKDLVPAYVPGNLLYDNESCMCLGAGGVYAVASDVADFGAAFFHDSDLLLKEEQKDETAKRWNGENADEYTDENGLGWDYVSKKKYEDGGVKVLGKGGDVLLNHAFLMVAPDEDISIAVLSNGGSSAYNGMLAEAIMDTVLKDRDISINDEVREYMAAGEIPGEYDELAGYYITQNALEAGAVVCRISFPRHEYMHVENISPINTSVADYIYTTDGKFAELACEVEDIKRDSKIAVSPMVLSFERNEKGNVYIGCERKKTVPGLGTDNKKTYIGEKLTANPVSNEILSAWEARCGKDLLLCNDIPSSANYQTGIIRAYMCREVPGYLFIITGQGTRLLKIRDEYHADAFMTMPSSSNRDVIDITVKEDQNETRLAFSSGAEYIFSDDIPLLSGSLSEIGHTGDMASWYRIGDDLAGTSFMIDEMPENSVVYVFSKYGDMVFTSHIKDAGNEIPLPKGGKVVFLGDFGESVGTVR